MSLPKAESQILEYDCRERDAYFFVFFLLLYETSAYVANDMIMPGMLSVVRSFNADDSMVSTALSAFILGGASLQIFLGPLSDRFGRRPIILIGVALFMLSTILIAISTSMLWFIVMRFFQGMGLCYITVIGYAALQEIFQEVAVVRLMAIMNNVTILAPLAGPLLGSSILLLFSWRAIFWVIAASSSLALVGLYLYMPETVGVHKKDGSLASKTPLALSIVKKNYLELCRNKRFITGSFALAVATIPIIAWIGTSPLILMKNENLGFVYYALFQIPIFLGAIIGNTMMRYYLKKRSMLSIIENGTWFILFSLVAMACVLYFKTHYLFIIIGMTIYSYGLGLITAPLNRLTLFSTLVPKGTASALLSVILMVLTAIGNQLSGLFYMSLNNFLFAIFCATCGVIYYVFFYYFRSTSA